MINIYDFLAGPAAWGSFAFCLVGLALKLAYFYGFTKGTDMVAPNQGPAGSGSAVYFTRPPGELYFRSQPMFAAAVSIYHACLFAAPLFLAAHNFLLQEYLGISFFVFPESVSDTITVIFFISGIFLILRRVIQPKVRRVTSARDYFLLSVSALPFLTGYLAYHQIGPYVWMLVLHVFTAELLLVIIPFSKPVHACLFFLARGFMGFEVLARRVWSRMGVEG